MKRLIFLIGLSLSWLYSLADTPALPLLKAFDGRFNNEKGVTIREISQPQNYYYSIDVEENPEVVKDIIEWSEETQKFANSLSKSINNGNYSIILFIREGNISVGIKYPGEKTKIKVFLQSSQPFLE